jgi:cysteine desulfuration protein SufE
MTVKERQAQLIDDLLIIPDVQERLSIVVSRAKGSLTEAEKVEANLVPGCVSRVWLVAESGDGFCHFRYDADSPMVKGLVGLLCEVYEGGALAEVASEEPVVLEQLGFTKLLSPTRLNGLAAVRRRIRLAAAAA